MVSRIEVIPSEVRGYGNIVEAKSVEDFVPVESDLVYSENVYSLTALEGLRITLTASQSSISYGSSVSLSATVVDDDSPVSGVSVSFYDGSTSLGSATTNSYGVATYTTSSLTVGTHSCTAVYDEKTSNSVSVTVNKLASTITLSVPASGTVGTSYTISGTLVPTSGSVKLYENGSLKDTLTVSSGSFSKSVTQNAEGTYSYYVVFEGSSTYDSVTSSTSSIVVEDIPVPSYDGVSLTSNKSILSYADSESATLTAQLLDGSSSASVSGVTVEFFKGSTSLGTATTNSSGVATKSYSSTGAGDVSLTASAGTFVSETYVIEDCIYYDSQTTDKNRYTTTTGTASVTYSSNGLTVKGTVNSETRVENTALTLPSEYVASIQITGKAGSGSGTQYYGGFAFDDLLLDFKGTTKGITFYTLSTLTGLQEITYTLQNNDIVTIERENGTMKVYLNDVLKYTYAVSSTGKFVHRTYNNRSITCKDLKVKPL